MTPPFDNELVEQFVKLGLKEDIGSGDFTSEACIAEDEESYAELLVKDSGIISGIVLAEYIFRYLDASIRFEKKKSDGDSVSYGDIAFTISGNSRAILKGERLVLNTMQQLSGISTLSRAYATIVKDLDVTVLDTRKTTPNMRFLEKWAVALGGCSNYRNGLYDWIMIKDNHVEAAGGVAEAMRAVHQFLKNNDMSLDITVEVRNIVELQEALRIGGFRRVMLDNFDLETTKKAVKMIGNQVESEASGGVTLETIRSIAETGVDYISVGALTHSADILDLSLKIRRNL